MSQPGRQSGPGLRRRHRRPLARELGPDGIRVNSVVRGRIMTERQLRDWDWATPEVERLVDSPQSPPGR